jgi:hypothetical protein
MEQKPVGGSIQWAEGRGCTGVLDIELDKIRRPMRTVTRKLLGRDHTVGLLSIYLY